MPELYAMMKLMKRGNLILCWSSLDAYGAPAASSHATCASDSPSSSIDSRASPMHSRLPWLPPQLLATFQPESQPLP